ncbi:histidine phosphatase family protein [Corynebacterium sp. TAE3-ERU12]|uniref:histidine phosphatase family protein n=1 Tax=Corynebacterium sp. TAE3-ERU12 TaxID=2849491 RepID=UPI001C483EF3|nr:histidine phosphatase family protein [Corynebacterium sp. TAE3-ERU12]MBV7294998.1 histidine phosphatase family protein [Corynebacterium sp. TAE3-ERU12]
MKNVRIVTALVGIAAASTMAITGCSTEEAEDTAASVTSEVTTDSDDNSEQTSDNAETSSADAEEAEEGEDGDDSPSEAEQKNADFKNKLDDEELLEGLQDGGMVVFIRHGQTEKDYADQASRELNLDDCSTQRALSEKGWDQALEIGAAFKKAEIPVGEVVSSEYCRAWQTAQLAFGKYDKDAALNFAKSEEYTDEQIEQMKDGITPYLSDKPAKGENNIIVGHDDVFEAATGIYPDPQGVAYVIQPKGDGKFELVAKLMPQDWTNLADKA